MPLKQFVRKENKPRSHAGRVMSTAKAERKAPTGADSSQQLQLLDRPSRAWVRANSSPEPWLSANAPWLPPQFWLSLLHSFYVWPSSPVLRLISAP